MFGRGFAEWNKSHKRFERFETKCGTKFHSRTWKRPAANFPFGTFPGQPAAASLPGSNVRQSVSEVVNFDLTSKVTFPFQRKNTRKLRSIDPTNRLTEHT